jgi:hypothetical protein
MKRREINRIAYHDDNIVKVTFANYKEEIIYEKRRLNLFKRVSIPVSTREILVSVEYEIHSDYGTKLYINTNDNLSDEEYRKLWADRINQGNKIVAQIDAIRYVK